MTRATRARTTTRETDAEAAGEDTTAGVEAIEDLVRVLVRASVMTAIAAIVSAVIVTDRDRGIETEATDKSRIGATTTDLETTAVATIDTLDKRIVQYLRNSIYTHAV